MTMATTRVYRAGALVKIGEVEVPPQRQPITFLSSSLTSAEEIPLKYALTKMTTAKPAHQGTGIFPADLPFGRSAIFKDSSFFHLNGPDSVLPSPVEVVAEARRRGMETEFHPRPLHYPSLGLTVKYGRNVSTAEGQCLWAVRQSLGDTVPVPEVYGWTVEADVSYIYMEYIPGDTLIYRWGSLSESEKQDICGQLRMMVDSLRSLKQPNGEKFIGTISREPLLDHAFTTSSAPPMGPFASVEEFHDLFAKLPRPYNRDPSDPPHPFRVHLPDDVPIVFTHADLHRGNIIISPPTEGERPRVKAIVDWGQSGWYPSYWEHCKALWTGSPTEEWNTIYIPLFVDPFDRYDYWDYFLLSMGV
ncbi:unnamed protein product [Rhizoctonia solani]|uniref:Aminoglycoside phosphotransferase domain-containing protein n=1 Tax=Rhizoctonia solani TaxID=456999 RepID=A0A8H3DXC6_9AGAM|nr:unnamed protein product [Rhizoctonia solani]